jgi:hypothetical protein
MTTRGRSPSPVRWRRSRAGRSYRVFLQHLLGFKKLGWDAVPGSARPGDASTKLARAPLERSWNVRYFLDVMSCFGLADQHALLDTDGVAAFGRAGADPRAGSSRRR